jgi:hypothetical protein
LKWSDIQGSLDYSIRAQSQIITESNNSTFVKKKKKKKKKRKKKKKEKKSAFVMNIVTVDSATCIDISIVSFLN